MGFGHLLRQALRLTPKAAAVQGFRYLARLAKGKLAQARQAQALTYLEPPPGPLPVVAPELSDPFPATDAEAIAAHRFNLLGSGPLTVAQGMDCPGFLGVRFPPVPPPADGDLAALVSPGNRARAQAIRALVGPAYRPIDWQLDFRSGHRWSEAAWHATIPYGHLKGVDVKLPWELGRLQHLPRLALAFVQDRRPRWRDEFRDQVLDFLAANPPGFGVDWACPMDVAIRGANLVLAHGLFVRHDARFDAAFEAELAAGLLAHGRHVRAHLEWHETRRGNHYLADLAGLLWLAAGLPPGVETTEWETLALKELADEILRQFGPDGGGFEASTSYHRLTTEMAAWCVALALGRGRGGTFGREHAQRLFRAAEFSRHITKPNGRVAQIGDNDSGRFFDLLPAPDLDHGSVGAIVGGLFGAEPTTLETALVAGLAGGHRLDGGPAGTALARRVEAQGVECGPAETLIRLPDPTVLEGLAAAAYPDFGLYLWRGPRFFLSVRCGTFGKDGTGGHAHNDQLALELNIDGVDWLADPGSFVYTPDPELRNAYRSVLAHAAPKQGRREPAPLDGGLFRLEDRAQGICLRFDATGFHGMHRGFGTPVQRAVEIDRGQGVVVIRDSGPAGRVDVRTPEEARAHLGSPLPFSPGYGRR